MPSAAHDERRRILLIVWAGLVAMGCDTTALPRVRGPAEERADGAPTQCLDRAPASPPASVFVERAISDCPREPRRSPDTSARLICLEELDAVGAPVLERVHHDGRHDPFAGHRGSRWVEQSDVRSLVGGGFRFVGWRPSGASPYRVETDLVTVTPDGRVDVTPGGAPRLVELGGRSFRDPSSRDGRRRVEVDRELDVPHSVVLFDTTRGSTGAPSCFGDEGCAELARFSVEGARGLDHALISERGDRFGLVDVTSEGAFAWIHDTGTGRTARFEVPSPFVSAASPSLGRLAIFEDLSSGRALIVDRTAAVRIEVEGIVTTLFDPCERFLWVVQREDPSAPARLHRVDLATGRGELVRELPSWVARLDVAPDGSVLVAIPELPSTDPATAMVFSPMGGSEVTIPLPVDAERVTYAPP